MWSTKTNNIFGAILVCGWLIVGSNYIGNLLIPPFEPNFPESTGGSAVAAVAPKPAEPVVPLPVLLASANVEKGAKVAKKCASCHTFEKGGKNKVGPNLFNMIGHDRGGVAGFKYSSAIQKMGGKWGFEDMDKFLAKPKAFMPGTKMSFSGLKSAKDRAALIVYLRNFADTPVALPK